MSYYEEKKAGLEELLRLIRKEKTELESLALFELSKVKERREGLKALAESYINDEARASIHNLSKEKSQGFPWLAKAYDDFFRLQDLKMEDYLQGKSHPAKKTAGEHRQVAKERREAEKAARISSYLLDYCRYLAPWLDEYIGLEVQELEGIIKDIHTSWEKKEEEFENEVKRHFGPKLETLAPSERLQEKLDWYRNRPSKSDWQIGRDYERYIGYLYEKDGWVAYYHGKKGFEDLGRDLVCKKNDNVEIVQCKRWAQDKLVHEKNIYYLFGTTVEYFLENQVNQQSKPATFQDLLRNSNVVAKLVTTTDCSEKATQVADLLGVSIVKIPFSNNYPVIKCNISLKTGEKIFHLPFDQQYDTAIIMEEKLERYVATVAEAEVLGFRHAYRWKGESDTK